MRFELHSKTVGSSRGVTSTSRSWLARLREDESAAWDRLVDLYSPLVYFWCRKLNLAEQDMPDVFQEVFQSVASHIRDFRKERPSDTFRGWLRTITRNKVNDHFRRQVKQPQAAGGTEARIRFSQHPAPEETDSGDSNDDRAHRELYHRALSLIREDFEPRTWKAFWRVVVDGQSPKDVGEELNMRPGTVRVAKSRVLQRLRQELGDVLE